MMRTSALGAAVALAVHVAAPARADFAAAAQAYDGGDYQAALAEWRRLGEAGDPAAQIAVAGMYRFGEGIPQDIAAAAEWYRRAAEQGEAIAQLNLGELYARGLGVARDPVEAHMWLSLAAAQGNMWAAERRDVLARGMRPEDLDRAEARARAWRRN